MWPMGLLLINWYLPIALWCQMHDCPCLPILHSEDILLSVLKWLQLLDFKDWNFYYMFRAILICSISICLIHIPGKWKKNELDGKFKNHQEMNLFNMFWVFFSFSTSFSYSKLCARKIRQGVRLSKLGGMLWEHSKSSRTQD